jgi:hypothetical protein
MGIAVNIHGLIMALRKTVNSLLVAGVAVMSGIGQAGAATTIEWSVVNNFRLLLKKDDQQWLKELARASKDLKSSKFTVDDVLSKWPAMPATSYDETRSSYPSSYVYPKSWVVKVSLPGAARNDVCSWWTVAEDTLTQPNNAAPKSMTGACTDFLLTITPGPHRLKVNNKRDNAEASVRLEVKDRLIVALGDSYSAGEGQPDARYHYLQARQAKWWDNKCHRSLYAWPVLAAARYADEHPQEAVTFISRACSGAVIDEVINNDSRGSEPELNVSSPRSMALASKENQDPESTHPVIDRRKIWPQIRQLRWDLCESEEAVKMKRQGTQWFCKHVTPNARRPDAILMTIGGNDAGFAPVTIDALLGKVNRGNNLKEKYKQTVTDAINRLETRFPVLAKALRQEFPNTAVIQALYPDPFHFTPGRFCGRDELGRQSRTRINQQTTTSIDFIRASRRLNLDILPRIGVAQISYKETAALWSDFYSRLIGRPPLQMSLEDSPMEQQRKRAWSHDYRGLLSIGCRLENENKKDTKDMFSWRVVPTTKYFQKGEAGAERYVREYEIDVDHVLKDDDDIAGYCREGNKVSGRWFVNANDSAHRIGGRNPVSGAMHPNIFGQLHFVSKVYPVLEQLIGSQTNTPVDAGSSGASPSACGSQP